MRARLASDALRGSGGALRGVSALGATEVLERQLGRDGAQPVPACRGRLNPPVPVDMPGARMFVARITKCGDGEKFTDGSAASCPLFWAHFDDLIVALTGGQDNRLTEHNPLGLAGLFCLLLSAAQIELNRFARLLRGGVWIALLLKSPFFQDSFHDLVGDTCRG